MAGWAGVVGAATAAAASRNADVIKNRFMCVLRCAAGAVAPGTCLPSVRTLASDLGVNLNTVARAYRLLQEEGFVTIHGRSRVEAAAPARRADAQRRTSLTTGLREALARLRQAGVPAGQLRKLVDREIDALS